MAEIVSTRSKSRAAKYWSDRVWILFPGLCARGAPAGVPLAGPAPELSKRTAVRSSFIWRHDDVLSRRKPQTWVITLFSPAAGQVTSRGPRGYRVSHGDEGPLADRVAWLGSRTAPSALQD